jgi:hypothetical protein
LPPTRKSTGGVDTDSEPISTFDATGHEYGQRELLTKSDGLSSESLYEDLHGRLGTCVVGCGCGSGGNPVRQLTFLENRRQGSQERESGLNSHLCKGSEKGKMEKMTVGVDAIVRAELGSLMHMYLRVVFEISIMPPRDLLHRVYTVRGRIEFFDGLMFPLALPTK